MLAFIGDSQKRVNVYQTEPVHGNGCTNDALRLCEGLVQAGFHSRTLICHVKGRELSRLGENIHLYRIQVESAPNVGEILDSVQVAEILDQSRGLAAEWFGELLDQLRQLMIDEESMKSLIDEAVEDQLDDLGDVMDRRRQIPQRRRCNQKCIADIAAQGDRC